MRRAVFIMLVLGLLGLTVPTWGKDNPDPAAYPLTGHVVSANFIHTTAPSNQWVSEVQIGATVYTLDDVCKAAKVGSDYPAKLDADKLHLLVGNKVCKYRVTGSREK